MIEKMKNETMKYRHTSAQDIYDPTIREAFIWKTNTSFSLIYTHGTESHAKKLENALSRY